MTVDVSVILFFKLFFKILRYGMYFTNSYIQTLIVPSLTLLEALLDKKNYCNPQSNTYFIVDHIVVNKYSLH